MDEEFVVINTFVFECEETSVISLKRICSICYRETFPCLQTQDMEFISHRDCVPTIKLFKSSLKI